MSKSETTVRLNELLAALSLACDAGNDFPIEKGLRNTLIATRLAADLRLDRERVSAIYYVGLLRFIGCSAYAHETAKIFPDDNAMRGAMARVDFRYPLEAMRQASTLGRGTLGAARAVAVMATRGKALGEGMQRADCEVMIRGAERLGLTAAVARGLGDVYERWDGHGGPRGLRGDTIDISARILAVAHEAEIHYRISGLAGACAFIKRGAGGWFDPAIAASFVRHAGTLIEPLQQSSVWETVLEAEPQPHLHLTADRVEHVARLFADLADLKCAWTLGHSTAVAELAADAAGRLPLERADGEMVRAAGLLHDIGRLSVPTGIWNKPGPLSRAEWERVRLHPYYAERTLCQSPLLAPIGRLAAAHHERLDGSGYHRGVPGSMLSLPARVLAAADVYQAMCEPRSHRPRRTADAAADQIQQMARRGALDREAVRAVCEAAGHRLSKRTGGWPAGLSDREVEVLRHLARGESEKQIGARLFISPATVHTHVVHIYAKIGASTRATAALFAMEHDLLR